MVRVSRCQNPSCRYDDLCADIERAGLDGHPMLARYFRTEREPAEPRDIEAPSESGRHSQPY